MTMRLAPVARSSFVRSVGHFSSAIIIGVLSMQTSYAGPEGGQVVRGNGNIVRPNATTTNINQHTQNIAIDWQSFNVSQNETVNFYQPNSTSTALNRIFDQNASEIFGTINANGRVILVNANGIYFGQSAAVNVGALIASGMDINPDAFMNGDWTFANADGSTGGLIVNHGLLQAAEGGSVSLFGGGIRNTGTILANYGSINLAAGEQVTIDFDGDGLIQFAVDGELLENAYGLDAAVSNSGTLQADSGRVLLSAASANNVFAQVVNNEGVIQANGVTTDGGRVFLTGSGGDVINTGNITATSETGKGGEVHLLGDRVGLFGDALVDVSGATGGGTALIGGDYQGGNGVQTASHTAIGTNAVIRADATDTGNGGKVIIWSDDTTRFLGAVSARGGANAGDGGFVEVSGKEYLEYRGDVDTTAVNGAIGTLLLDPADIVIAGGTGGTDDAAITGDGQALFADGTGTFTISEDAIESTDSNIILEATNSITASGTFGNDETGEGAGVLILQTNRNLTLRTRNAAAEGSGGIDLPTSAHGNDLQVRTRGTGSITLTAGTDGVDAGGDAGSAGITVGRLTTASGTFDTGSITLTAEGDININGAVTTGDAQDTNNDQASGALSITSSTGGITVAATGSLNTGNAQANGNNNSATSGALTLSAASNIVLNSAVTAGTATTNDDLATGGAISITSTGGSVTTNVGASLATGVVSGDDTGASTSGNIAVAGASGVNIGETVATGGVTSLDDAGHSGDISLSSSAGSVTSS
ncbi:MAG: filamentous hemagglutinin N-terminal domain-containing protein, partial [Proteobacteria bacterium]|nr:filamentous hemagglutinin N-terminal domain-containing protein [Pseudomonadota bacterium]